MRERLFTDPAARERYQRKLDALVNERRKLLASLSPDELARFDDVAHDDEDCSGANLE